MAQNRIAKFSKFDQEEFLERKLREKKKSLARKKKIVENQKRRSYINDESGQSE